MAYLEFRYAFHARDFAAAVSFYRNTLHLRYVGGWDRADGKGALLAAAEGGVVEIYGPAEGQTYNGPSPVAINLALRLPDAAAVDALYAELSAAGARVEGAPQNRLWGHRSFIVYDPDAVPVHVYCEL